MTSPRPRSLEGHRSRYARRGATAPTTKAIPEAPTTSRGAAPLMRCSLSVLVLSVKPRLGRGVGLVGGAGRVRADAQPYLGPRSGVAPDRRRQRRQRRQRPVTSSSTPTLSLTRRY